VSALTTDGSAFPPSALRRLRGRWPPLAPAGANLETCGRHRCAGRVPRRRYGSLVLEVRRSGSEGGDDGT